MGYWKAAECGYIIDESEQRTKLHAKWGLQSSVCRLFWAREDKLMLWSAAGTVGSLRMHSEKEIRCLYIKNLGGDEISVACLRGPMDTA